MLTLQGWNSLSENPGTKNFNSLQKILPYCLAAAGNVYYLCRASCSGPRTNHASWASLLWRGSRLCAQSCNSCKKVWDISVWTKVVDWPTDHKHSWNVSEQNPTFFSRLFFFVFFSKIKLCKINQFNKTEVTVERSFSTVTEWSFFKLMASWWACLDECVAEWVLHRLRDNYHQTKTPTSCGSGQMLETADMLVCRVSFNPPMAKINN